MTPQTPRNILLIQLGDIGDVVLSFSCVRALKETFPEANIVVVVWEKAKELMHMCRWVSDVMAVSKQKRNLIGHIRYEKGVVSKLRSYHFDMAIDLRTGTRGAIMTLLSGAERRMSFYAEDGKLWRNRVFTDLYKHVNVPHLHVIDYHLNLLQAFNITTKDEEPELTVPKEKKQEIRELLIGKNIPHNRPLVVIQPFSLWKYKEWGAEKFFELINWIYREYKLPVLICGGQDEHKKAAQLVQKCGEGVFNLAGSTSISMYAALLKYCSLLISVDSSGPHIAAAAGTPTVTIFGPASPKTWSPRGDMHSVVQSSLPCVPCHQTGCNGTMVSRCLDELTLAEVQKVVERQISRVLT